jgi:AcrR family transcriptional regulator
LTATSLTAKPLRADATRNRAKVLAGARKAFRTLGLDADMAEVARQSGVGVGTVYRHFPTKDALTTALAVDHFGQLAVMAEEAVADESGDPWDTFEAFIWRSAELTAGDLAMCEVLGLPTTAEATGEPGKERLLAALVTLVDRAKAGGKMREDANGRDIPMIMCGFGKVRVNQARLPDLFDWRRYLTIALDGLRAR